VQPGNSGPSSSDTWSAQPDSHRNDDAQVGASVLPGGSGGLRREEADRSGGIKAVKVQATGKISGHGPVLGSVSRTTPPLIPLGWLLPPHPWATAVITNGPMSTAPTMPISRHCGARAYIHYCRDHVLDTGTR
jgi:hypothetical protein